jgi:hypothetical protein
MEHLADVLKVIGLDDGNTSGAAFSRWKNGDTPTLYVLNPQP